MAIKSVSSITCQDPVGLTCGKLLARNATWNLIGQCAPIAIALITIPLIVKGMGTDRYGMLTLAWMILGYFSLFDMGLSRALTKLVAENLGAGHRENLPGLIWTALLMMLTLGLAGGSILAVLSHWLTYSVLKIPPHLKVESLNTFYLLSLSVPVVICNTALRGVLEAQQRFKLVAMVNTPLGIFTYAGPLITLQFTESLFWMVVLLLVGRFVATLIYFVLCTVTVPELAYEYRFQRSLVRPLFSFGSWMTVSNIISPLMVNLDRFLIGAIISVSAVAYYATPFDVVMRILVIPTAITGVLFPAFSTSYAQDRGETVVLYNKGMKNIFLILFPIITLTILFANLGLDWWLGADFAQKSSGVLRLLAIGVFFNGLARFPYSLLQGIGRPDLTTIIHLFEFPFYVFFVLILTNSFGIAGTAIAWMMRSIIDLVLLNIIARKVLKNTNQNNLLAHCL